MEGESRLSFLLPVSRPAAAAAVEAVAAGRSAVGALGAAPRRSGGEAARGGGEGRGLAPSPLCECRLGQSPLPAGSVRRAGLPGLTLPLSEVPRGRAGGERAPRTARGGNGTLWGVLERGSWQGNLLNKAVSCINGASGVPCTEHVNTRPSLTRISSVTKPATVRWLSSSRVLRFCA